VSGVRLVGANCVLRDWREPDVATYRDYLGPEHDWHDTNGPYFGRPNEAEADRAAARARATLDGALPTPRQLLVIALRADEDRLVGMINWYWECFETDWRRIGIGLYDPAARGRGIGTEALRLWTAYLFDSTDALRLDLMTYSGNPAMCRAALAAGYVEEARLRQARRWSGGVHDALVYAALRDEWQLAPVQGDTP
jgi:RimJ/RimL family protein N-acetyltransferase